MYRVINPYVSITKAVPHLLFRNIKCVQYCDSTSGVLRDAAWSRWPRIEKPTAIGPFASERCPGSRTIDPANVDNGFNFRSRWAWSALSEARKGKGEENGHQPHSHSHSATAAAPAPRHHTCTNLHQFTFSGKNE